MSKTRFVVYEEHTFGFIAPEDQNYIYILQALVTRGATFGAWGDWRIPIIAGLDNFRPATRQDFIDYRIGLNQYEDEDRYELPKE